MASRLQVAPGEYLATSFDGTDREYVRGEIVERSRPNFLHGEMQVELGFRFRQLRDSHHLFACSETRMRLADDLYRIPDLAVFAESKPDEPVPSRPPLVTIEIISPDDRYSEMLEKLAEYQEWRVANIWVVDPHRRTLAVYQDEALRTVPRLALAGYPFALSAELFSSVIS
jgi:Uma2 family endonuclease